MTASDRRRLADECEAIRPIFSTDGRWIFAALYDAESRVCVQHFRTPGFAGELRGDGTRKTTCGSP
jgi:hypothetical protein